MRPIGWTLACVLLATSFSKSAISLSVDSVGVATVSKDESARAKLTKLVSVSTNTIGDPDVWLVRRFLDDLFGDENKVRGDGSRGRTFGVKRIQFMLMPMVYKMGVMMTMLTVLTIISLKGLLIGATLLMLKLSTIIAKFSSGWQQHASSWSPQPVHVHVHNSMPLAHNHAYNGWIPPHSGPEEEEHYYYRG
ncbi:uncharacterized protein LOC143183813 [Calliopsis andreniformis]|uniref:uncharacterized protein LOC143183813 n=1 Tax=Calliopsis andreniformis TaxID=337506 RepID=UPI003FCC74F9